ncbi:MAG: hypothetical protein JWN00_5175 [Actinomycetia bacterium]|nr:hypothetical protein [Actinomycetes bacterium]
MGRPWLIAGAACVLVAGLGGGAWVLRAVSQSCQGAPLAITVAAQPEIAPAIREIAARFNLQAHEVRGQCARVDVVERASASVARELAGPAQIDGWIPESWMWVDFARRSATGAKRILALPDSIAVSPVVLAVPMPLAGRTTWKAFLHGRPDLVRQMPDPGAGAAGLVTMLAADRLDPGGPGVAGISATATSTTMNAELTGLPRNKRPVVVTTEQQVAVYNDTHQPNPAAAEVPEEGTLLLDYPYTITAFDPARREAADAFHNTLRSTLGEEAVQRYGFRTPEGVLAPDLAQRFDLQAAAPRQLAQPSTDQVNAAYRAWRKSAPAARMLILLDASTSMHGARLQAAGAALRGSLSLLPAGTDAGLWSFAGTRPYQELVPLGPLTARLSGAVGRVRTGEGFGLYNAVVDGYRTVLQGWRADRANLLLVITDGDEDAVRLQTLSAAVRAEQDPKRPVQIVTVAFPGSPGAVPLQQVADLTGGALYTGDDLAGLVDQALAPYLCTPLCT